MIGFLYEHIRTREDQATSNDVNLDLITMFRNFGLRHLFFWVVPEANFSIGCQKQGFF